MSRMMVSDFEEDETIDEDVNLLFEGENSLDSKIIVSVNKNSPEKNIIDDLNDDDSSLVILEQDNYNELNFKIENSEKEEDFSKKDEQEIALSD
jgi:translation elongation factor P/translation initiation factor 5A